jgi:hypothetical protein
MNADDTDHKEIYSERILHTAVWRLFRSFLQKGPHPVDALRRTMLCPGILSSRMVLRAKRNNLEGILFRKDLNASPHCRVEDS